MSETLLIAKCIAGDRLSQKALYNQHAPKMFAVCLRYARCRQDAEDLLQTGFLRVFNKLHTYNADGSFEGWCRRIFVNTSLEYVRALRQPDACVEDFINVLECPAANVLDDLHLKDMQKEISTLSKGFQTVFSLYAIEGYKHPEIAPMLNITVSTSKSQYHRARGVLQKAVKEK